MSFRQIFGSKLIGKMPSPTGLKKAVPYQVCCILLKAFEYDFLTSNVVQRPISFRDARFDWWEMDWGMRREYFQGQWYLPPFLQ